MFGGLDIKEKSGKESKEDEKAAVPAVGGSAFGFMNPTAASSAATNDSSTPAASSGFSFMNGGSESAANAAVPPSVPASTSGFSFMQPSPATDEPSSSKDQETAQETTSGFSFMIPSPAVGSEEEAKPPPLPETSSALPGGGPSSAFSFMSAGSSAAIPEPSVPPADDTIPATAVISASSSLTSNTAPSPIPPVNVLEAPAPAPAPSGPAGAGITFGTATAPKIVRKKKSRAQRVGMGATVQSPAVAAAPVPAPPPAAATATQKADSPKSTRDAADDAARRAEEFMEKQKAITEKVDNSSGTPAIKPTASTDEEVAAAMAAAEEAKTMSLQQQKNQPKGFMGTFFKGFGGSNSSLGSNNGRRPSPTQATTANGTSSNSVDRLAKKQEDMKRAMAEREIQMQQQALADKDDGGGGDDDDDEVVVSEGVAGYQPQSIPSTTTMKETPETSSSHLSFEPAKPKATPQYVVREIAPAPKKKKTAKDKFEEYEALFAQSIHRAMEQVENVRGQQRMLLEDRFVSLAKQSLATQQIEQTESQLQVAVDEEDYELADQLGQVIEAHKREKNEVAMFLDSITAGLAQLDSQKSLVVKGVASCFENLTVRLTELQENESATEQTNETETLKQFASISKQLSAEQERLQRDLKAIELDEERAVEERNELEASISEQAGEFEKQKESVEKELSETDSEIEELRKQLEEKQKKAASLRKDMYGLEDSISRVRVKFARQLNRVDKKERSVRENRIEYETEIKTFQQQKDAHEHQVKTHSENLLAHDELVKVLEEELRLAKEFSEFVPTKLGILEDPMDPKEKDSESEGDLAQLQADVVKCEAAVSEAKVLLKAASAAIQKLETEHASLIAKIPQLEEAKKSAAAKRDFKAAGKASKDIKDATSRLKECEEELVGDAAEKKKHAEDELKKLDAELVVAREVAQGKEKISAQRKMAALASKIQVLVSTKGELCGDCSSSENNVRGVGALVLDMQIKALQVEGESLGKKYGGWDGLVHEEIGDDDGKGQAQDGDKEKEFEEKQPSATTAVVIDKARITKARELIQEIQIVEEGVEAAAANDKYEEAGELQEKSEKLQAELEGLGLSEQEMELALAEEDPATAPESEEHATIADANDEAVAADVDGSEEATNSLEETSGPTTADEETAREEGAVPVDNQVIEGAASDEKKENDNNTTIEAEEPISGVENGEANQSKIEEAEKIDSEDSSPQAMSTEE